MANQLAQYNFPDAYSTLVSNFTGTVKYVATTGSDSNNGNSVTTPYLTIDYAYNQTTATANVMIVVLQGTYTMTAVTDSASTALRDGGKQRVYVCCPGKTIIQWTASTGARDCHMAQFTSAASAVYGAILKRNNNARSTNYTVAFFRSYDGALKGNFYNCVFQETNANNAWSYQYDNYGAANFAIRNCTFYNGAAPAANYTNAGTCLTIDSVFNTTCTTGGTETNVLKSQTVNATTYVTTGVTTAGVYSGSYDWNGLTTYPAANVVSVTNGTSYASADGLFTYYKFTQSGSITLNNSSNVMGVEVITTAGGGGGVGGYGGNAVPSGGGGAGGVVYHSNYVISNGTYAITVGGGGAAALGTGASAVGGTGSDSIFGSNLIVAKGGGGGGWYQVGGNGGSGGGGGYSGAAGGTSNQGSSGVNPSGSVYYGNSGGVGATISQGSGGGGGAGAVGAAAGTNGGDGGAGANAYSTILSTVSAGQLVSGLRYIAGGGGGGGGYSSATPGGAGGAGGGGAGGTSAANAGAGTTNTGGGGGGAPNALLGGAGGSGLVVLKVYTGVPNVPGIYGPASISSGAQIPLTLVTSNLADNTTVSYTITGVTSNDINGGSLTGNLNIVSNVASITINTNSFIASANLVFSANSYTKNVSISFPATITTTLVPVTMQTTESNIINPIPGNMNVPEMVVSLSQYDLSLSSNAISGQMNIFQSPVTVNNATLSLNIEPLLFNTQLSNTIIPYTTITNSFAGAIDTSIIKLFGEIAQREYWM